MGKSNGWISYKKLLLEAHADNKKRLDRIEQSIMEVRIELTKIITRDATRAAIFGTIGGGLVTISIFVLKLLF